MKLVVEIGAGLLDAPTLNSLVMSVGQLLADGHRVVLVHDGVCNTHDLFQNGDSALKGVHDEDAFTRPITRINKTLVASMGRVGIPAIGLNGADGNLVRVRVRKSDQADEGPTLEVVAVDPFWLDTITKGGGVPVMANLAVGPDLRYQNLCPDQLAAASAIGWRVDALIFLTRVEGVRDNNGLVLRWMGAEQIQAQIKNPGIAPEMLSKLRACHEAAKNGVPRVRILPFSQAQMMSVFFNERINFGTEIFVSAAGAEVEEGAFSHSGPKRWNST